MGSVQCTGEPSQVDVFARVVLILKNRHRRLDLEFLKGSRRDKAKG